MRIHIKTTGFDMTPPIKEYTEGKVGELQKFVKSMSGDKDDSEGVNAFVEVGKTRGGQKKGDDLYMAEIQLHLPGTERIVVRVEEANVHAAIDKARIEMKNRLNRHKGKKRAKSLRGASAWKQFTRINFLARRRNNQKQEFNNEE